VAKVTLTEPKDKSALQLKVERAGYVWNDELGMAEHRAVAYKVLGRFLDTKEIVHHCDHDKQNNAPENLFVVTEAVHDIIHISTLIHHAGRSWPCGYQLKLPDVLAKFLKDEGIPHIWLWEAEHDKGSHNVRGS